MNLLDIISDGTKITLGWTLLHTLWQGALIFLVIKFVHWFTPARSSSLKYLLNCCALVLLFASSLMTFLYLHQVSNTELVRLPPLPVNTIELNQVAQNSVASIKTEIVQFVNFQMPLILKIWFVGVLLFTIRFLTGLVYIRFLKSNTQSVNTFWEDQLSQLSKNLGVTQLVSMVESIHINKPLVVGFVKPVILLPIGLLSGLPQDQVESILIHELSHIKRHDYIINIIQSVIEIVLFFNPFVWIISKMIRDEREHCCDDQVINSGSSRITYAKALAKLEEQRLVPAPTLALALNKNRYQVFNRIKRIMETHVKSNHGKARPFNIIAIVITALICASWLSVGSNATHSDETITMNKPKSTLMSADTIKDKNKSAEKDKNKKERSASFSRQTITTYDEDGNPHEEIIENFEGDEELRGMLSEPGNYTFSMPAVPNFPSIPSVPAMPSFPAIPFDHSYHYSFSDTIPGGRFFTEEDEQAWAEFGREMEKRFQHFGLENEEFAKQMEQWAEHFGNNFSLEFNENFHDKMDRLHESLEELHNSKEFKEKLDHGLRGMEEQLQQLEENLQRHKNEIRHMEENMKKYEAELHEQLIKDGYLKKGEKVNTMNWGDGSLTINGTRIKDKDLAKYEAINKKYFKNGRGVHIRH